MVENNKATVMRWTDKQEFLTVDPEGITSFREVPVSNQSIIWIGVYTAGSIARYYNKHNPGGHYMVVVDIPTVKEEG